MTKISDISTKEAIEKKTLTGSYEIDQEDELELDDLELDDLDEIEEYMDAEPENLTGDLGILGESQISLPDTQSRISKERSEAGYISIVNSKKNGKRLIVSPRLLKKLNYKEDVDLENIGIAFTDGGIVFGLDDSFGAKFNVKKQKSKLVIYNSALISEVAEKYSLDFSGITTMTFIEGTLMKLESSGKTVFKVKL